jgi:nucleoside-diphosphate-sugar epimerase
MGKRIAFTGGSGKVGRTVVPYLIERGHEVLNLDLKPLDAANWKDLRLRCPTARLGSCWASARSTTGENTSPAPQGA